jgi:hypothetical protein
MSAAMGLAFRAIVSRTISQTVLYLGLGSLIVGLGIVGLIIFSKGRLFGVWAAVGFAGFALFVAAVTLPFTLVVRWGRS